MRGLYKLAGLIAFAARRHWHHPGLTLLGLVRVIFAVGLIASASFFSDAVQRVILDRLLTDLSEVTERPPFSTLVYTYPTPLKPVPLSAVEDLLEHVAGTLSSEVGLPVKQVGLRVGSGAMTLLPGAGSSRYREDQVSLGVFQLVYIPDVGEHIDVMAGEPFDLGASREALDVWMHAQAAEEIGAQVGETFTLSGAQSNITLPLRLVGFWRARDGTEPFWFDNPDNTLTEAFLVRRGDYITHVQPLLPSRTRQVFWHIILDERKVDPADVRGYLDGFERSTAIIGKFVPGARLSASPLVPLEKFVQRETVLTTLLLSFNVPAFGFLLYFLVLTSAIIARWQQGETAALVSRGVNRLEVLGLTLIDEVLLFIAGLPLGVGFGMVLARLMGYTSSFLSFVDRAPIPVSLAGIDWVLVLVALFVAAIARLLPAVRAAEHSVVTFERERARPLRAPFWYRHYLDFLLLLVVVYVYRQLADTGTLALLVQDRPQDLYQDPLLILVPALFVLTAAMLTVRLLRLLMRLTDVLAGWLPWVTPHMVLRRLSRQLPEYLNPLLLIIVSLGLGVYTLSMAASLDQWLVDRVYYSVGADMAFKPLPPVASTEGGQGPIDGAWIPIPDELASLPGVVAATRFGDYGARMSIPGGNEVIGRFLAIDRVDLTSVIWFRSDLTRESLGGLLNRLALVPDGILVSEALLQQNHLQVGDTVRITVSASQGIVLTAPFTVAGSYDYFPTVYEEERFAVIGNLDFLSSLMGAPLPHNLFLRTDQEAEGKEVLKAVWGLGIGTTAARNARGLIQEEQAGMERVGVFGTLSVGFLAAVVMAAVGLMLYTYASLRERLFRFAVLRAMGLNRRQIVGQVILEYALLTVVGAAIGATIGIGASELFVPFFKITGEQGIPLPPLIPIIARGQVDRLVVGFVSIMVLLQVPVVARALSWRHFQMLRAGEG